MRELKTEEIDQVSGGADFWFDFGFVGGTFSGSEFIASYYYAVEQTRNFFTWWDPAGYYD
jgi:hypothetical protein